MMADPNIAASGRGKATRRGLLAGVVGSGLLSALGFPAAIPVQAAPVPEDPWLRARRLARELSDALVDLDHGEFDNGGAVLWRRLSEANYFSQDFILSIKPGSSARKRA